MRITHNKKSNSLTCTLSREDSAVWAGSKTLDGRDLDNVRRRNRNAVKDAMDRTGAVFAEVYASKRHGGCGVDVIDRRDAADRTDG